LIKDELRKKYIELRKNTTHEQRVENSKNITEKVISYIEEHSITSVHTYLSIQNELSTDQIIEYCFHKKIPVTIPKCIKKKQLKILRLHSFDNLITGNFGTRYPKEEIKYTEPLHLIIVPGLGFDHNKNRLGFGAGYYDRFLASHKSSIKIGLAFDFQIAESLPYETHDIPMDIIFTPTRVL